MHAIALEFDEAVAFPYRTQCFITMQWKKGGNEVENIIIGFLGYSDRN